MTVCIDGVQLARNIGSHCKYVVFSGFRVSAPDESELIPPWHILNQIVTFRVTMMIAFKSRKLEKTLNSGSLLERKYGKSRARAIMMRLAVLANAPTLAAVPHTPPERRHQLTGDREGHYVVDLDDRARLILAPNHDPVPLLDDGGIDIQCVTAITIMEVTDYH